MCRGSTDLGRGTNNFPWYTSNLRRGIINLQWGIVNVRKGTNNLRGGTDDLHWGTNDIQEGTGGHAGFILRTAPPILPYRKYPTTSMMMFTLPPEAFWTPMVPVPLVDSSRTELLARVFPTAKLMALVPRGKALPG